MSSFLHSSVFLGVGFFFISEFFSYWVCVDWLLEVVLGFSAVSLKFRIWVLIFGLEFVVLCFAGCSSGGLAVELSHGSVARSGARRRVLFRCRARLILV